MLINTTCKLSRHVFVVLSLYLFVSWKTITQNILDLIKDIRGIDCLIKLSIVFSKPTNFRNILMVQLCIFINVSKYYPPTQAADNFIYDSSNIFITRGLASVEMSIKVVRSLGRCISFFAHSWNFSAISSLMYVSWKNIIYSFAVNLYNSSQIYISSRKNRPNKKLYH